jgi:cytochrome c peroxidase
MTALRLRSVWSLKPGSDRARRRVRPEGEGYLRWCFAASEALLDEGAARLARFLSAPRWPRPNRKRCASTTRHAADPGVASPECSLRVAAKLGPMSIPRVGWLVLFLLLLAPTLWRQPTSCLFRRRAAARRRTRPLAPKFQRDPSNRVSGTPARDRARTAAVLRSAHVTGRIHRLRQLPRAGSRICRLEAARTRIADLERNTIALANLRQQRWYDWAGSSDSLWLASLRPILNSREFDGSPASVARLFVRDQALAQCYRRVFGIPPTGDDERTLVNVGKALAAFLETLNSGRTAFDDYRDSLLRGQPVATLYPAAAQRGLKLFVGRAGCDQCHSGPNFSDGEFHDAGAPPPVAPARRDPGRAEGAQRLLESRFNRFGRYNDGARPAAPRVQIESEVAHFGQFRTPSLRNVAVTAPYMHNGRIESLADAVRQHANGHAGGSGVPNNDVPFFAADGEVADLVAFLQTLTDVHGNAARERSPANCRSDTPAARPP